MLIYFIDTKKNKNIKTFFLGKKPRFKKTVFYATLTVARIENIFLSLSVELLEYRLIFAKSHML